MKYFFINEDITLGVQRQKDWETPGGISPIAECLFMGQRLGIGAAIVSHNLSGLSPVIRQNIETWIVTRQSGEDPRLVCNLLSTTVEQAEKLRTLRPGEFVCMNPALWHKPVYATFSDPLVPGICDEAARRAGMDKFHSKVTTRPPAPLETFGPKVPAKTEGTGANPSQPELPSAQIEMLVIIATGPPKPATKVYALTGQTRAQCRRITKALESITAVSPHRFSTGRIGGQLCFFEITGYGWQVLQKKGISRPEPLTNGGFEHELAAQLLRAEAQRNSLAIDFEVDMGGLRLDAVMIDKQTGRRYYFNIGISRPEHEVDSIERFFTMPAAHSAGLTLVARDSSFAKKVRNTLKKRRLNDSIVKNVEIKLIADFVNV